MTAGLARRTVARTDEVGLSTELVVTRESLRAKIDTRLAGVAFGSDAYVCVDPGSLVKAAMRAVGRNVSKVQPSKGCWV